jgi:ComF family protein
LCGIETSAAAVCYACQKQTVIEHVWLSGNYEGEYAAIIRQFKFNYVRAAAKPLAKLLASSLPELSSTTIIVPIPTVPSHVRQRGYDHVGLLAKELSVLVKRPVVRLLERRTSTRQVGVAKRQRLAQAVSAFYIPDVAHCRDADVLLVDDVVTSGATLAAAASLLHQGGVRSINAVVIARQQLR